jgi:hypothetical protein
MSTVPPIGLRGEGIRKLLNEKLKFRLLLGILRAKKQIKKLKY